VCAKQLLQDENVWIRVRYTLRICALVGHPLNNLTASLDAHMACGTAGLIYVMTM